MRYIDADELIKDRVENDPVAIAVNSAPTIKIELPETPIECAEMLINAIFEYDTSAVQKAFGAGEKARTNYYSVDELRQIAKHLIVYCNHAENEE